MSDRNLEIKILAGGNGICLVLRDDGGIRASRECTDSYELIELLEGWQQEHPSEDISEIMNRSVESTPPHISEIVNAWLARGTRPDMEFLSPEEAQNLLRLLGGPSRPKEIQDLRQKIRADTAMAEVRSRKTGVMDMEQVAHIVEQKLRLDGLLTDWAKGRLS